MTTESSRPDGDDDGEQRGAEHQRTHDNRETMTALGAQHVGMLPLVPAVCFFDREFAHEDSSGTAMMRNSAGTRNGSGQQAESVYQRDSRRPPPPPPPKPPPPPPLRSCGLASLTVRRRPSNSC